MIVSRIRCFTFPKGRRKVAKKERRKEGKKERRKEGRKE
jgi:hypothetical protein